MTVWMQIRKPIELPPGLHVSIDTALGDSTLERSALGVTGAPMGCGVSID